MNNYIGFWDLETVQVSDGVWAYRAKCHRCFLTAQTTQDGPYKCAPDLTMLINTHICDPAKRQQC